MSEEMNEDNCVLDEKELNHIRRSFTGYIDECLYYSMLDDANKAFSTIFLKITKLNEMAKEKGK